MMAVYIGSPGQFDPQTHKWSSYQTQFEYFLRSTTSRHTVVCRAAQEAGAQPREYIDRKKENAIFAPP